MENTNNSLKISNIILLSFDNEIGQVVDKECPIGLIPKLQLKSISVMGFPETNHLTQEGDLGFIFKIRNDYNIPLKGNSLDSHSFNYCYTLFIQKKKKESKRGYIQKSIIIISPSLSKYYFFKLLYLLKDLLNDELTISNNTLELFLNSVNGININFNEVNTTININILEKELNIDCFKLKNETMSNKSDSEVLLSTGNSSLEEKRNEDLFEKEKDCSFLKEHSNFYEINHKWDDITKFMTSEHQFNNFFESFSLFYVAKLWQIWELIILEYPIIVYADNASRVSNIVFLLSSLTYPLPLNSDIRPYFSIYDSDFKEYQEEQDMRTHFSAILGVINPIFGKLINDWPVVLRFDEHYFLNDLKKKLPNNPLKSPLSQEITKYYDSKVNKSSTLYEIKKYMKTPRQFSLKANPQIISLFLDCLKTQGESSYDKLNCHLRMYFSELTKDFIKTFDDFLLLNEIKHIKRITLQKKNYSIFEIFNKERFIKYLKEKSNQNAFNYKYLHDKKKLVSLYSDFLETKCFRNYLSNMLEKIKNGFS